MNKTLTTDISNLLKLPLFSVRDKKIKNEYERRFFNGRFGQIREGLIMPERPFEFGKIFAFFLS
ncbi:MAG: hypothetical protein AAB600_03150 [Patescibacteria group bacterium]